MLVVLDSTVLIDYLRGRPVVDRVRKLKLQGDLPATTAINVEEIVRGLREAEVNVARRLFRGLVIVPIDEAVAWQAGSWRRRFSGSAPPCSKPTAWSLPLHTTIAVFSALAIPRISRCQRSPFSTGRSVHSR